MEGSAALEFPQVTKGLFVPIFNYNSVLETTMKHSQEIANILPPYLKGNDSQWTNLKVAVKKFCSKVPP